MAWRLATAFHTVFQPPLTQGILPTFSRVKDSNRHCREGIKFVLRLQSHFAVPGYVFVAATAPTLIALPFGADWAGAAPALRALAPMGVCYPLAATMRQFYYARGEQWRVFAIQRYYVPATLLGVVIGVPTAGVVGACAVISAGQVLAVLLFAREIHRDVGLELRQSLLPAVAAGVASAAVPAVLLWTDAVSLLSPFARLLAVGATVVVGFYSTLLILDRKRISEEFDIVRRALRD